MTMDKTAIQEIQQSAAPFIEQLKALDNPVALVPANMNLESLEAFQELRYDFRAKFQTSALEDFTAYVNDHKGKTCFLDIENRKAEVIFDLGNPDHPGHCRHRAAMSPKITPEFEALLEENGRVQAQRSFIEFLEDWREFWKAIDDQGEVLNQPAAFAALRSMTVESITSQKSNVEDLGESRSAMESIEARSEGAQIRRFLFTLKPYEGFKERTVECRFQFRAGGGLQLGLSIIGKGQLDKEISEEFQDLVEGALPDITLYKGKHSC